MRVRRGHEERASEFAAVIATIVAATARQAWVQETESVSAEQPHSHPQSASPPATGSHKVTAVGDSGINDAAVTVTGVRARVVV